MGDEEPTTKKEQSFLEWLQLQSGESGTARKLWRFCRYRHPQWAIAIVSFSIFLVLDWFINPQDRPAIVGIVLILGLILFGLIALYSASVNRYRLAHPAETKPDGEVIEAEAIDPDTNGPTWTGPETTITKIANLQAEAQVAINRARKRIFADENEPGFDREKAEQRLQLETSRILQQTEMEIMNVQRGSR